MTQARALTLYSPTYGTTLPRKHIESPLVRKHLQTILHISTHIYLFLSSLDIPQLPITVGYLSAEQPSFFASEVGWRQCSISSLFFRRLTLAFQTAATTGHFLKQGG